ncbi:hypothetical protein HanRHA438_Chr13g0589361 [Helianthus annuus]|nr:hypothetical protein HanRHA438_Chr13g0589361 [Helianthus annuus]
MIALDYQLLVVAVEASRAPASAHFCHVLVSRLLPRVQISQLQHIGSRKMSVRVAVVTGCCALRRASGELWF